MRSSSHETISRKTDLVFSTVEIGLQRRERNRVTNIINSIPGGLFGLLAMTMLKDMTETTEKTKWRELTAMNKGEDQQETYQP